MRATRRMMHGAALLWTVLAVGTGACAGRSSKPFVGDGTLMDLGANTPIVSYQLILTSLSAPAASQRRFVFSGIPSNRYWLALVVDGADRDKCIAIFNTREKGIDIDFGLQDDDSGTAIVPTMLMSGWRVSFSPSPKTYGAGPPSRRCVLYPDNGSLFQLDNAHKYTVDITIRRMELASSLPISIVLEGKGGSGEL